MILKFFWKRKCDTLAKKKLKMKHNEEELNIKDIKITTEIKVIQCWSRK